LTTTLWDFGDGVTSAVISATHEYTRTGVYTVTLTVGDGVDASVVTRTAYVRVGYRAFLPLVLRTYDALLYDDFGDTIYDGSYHPGKWQNCSTTGSSARQQAGALVITNTTLSSAGGGCLRLISPATRTLAQVQVFEAKLRLSSDRTGGRANVQTRVRSNAPGHGWYAECHLIGGAADAQAGFDCFIRYETGGGVYATEYGTQSFPVPFDAWVTARIEADPATANFRFYMNGSLIGSRTPSDAAALIPGTDFQLNVDAWTPDLTSTGTKYVDDVRITPVQP
jgi:PKD repeat protein